MRTLYNILFTLLFWLTSPYQFMRLRRRGNWVRGLGQRFGRYDAAILNRLRGRQTIWLHAVSVGEVNTCLQFIKVLGAHLPETQLVVSTTTTTGMTELRRKLPENVQPIYFPIDCRRYVVRALKAIHPSAVILVEREIWPNFIWRVQELDVPLFLINARVSDRSHRLCQRFGFLFQPLYAAFSGAAVQTERDAEKLRDLGCRPEVIRVFGSMKFDAATHAPRSRLDARGLLCRAGADNDSLVLLAGSTHAGEEKLMGEIFLRLRTKLPKLFLVLVPRHFERCPDVADELESIGLKPVLRTSLRVEDSAPKSEGCLLVDSTGELMSFYQTASVVFVGKSLKAIGGQNPLEPAALGRAVVFGPNMQNFAEFSRALVENEAAIQVTDADDLEETLSFLLADESKRTQLGANARRTVEANLGSTERTASWLVERLERSRAGHSHTQTIN